MTLPSCFWKTGAIVLEELPSFISRAPNSPRWRKQHSPTSCYLSTRLHGVTSQKTT